MADVVASGATSIGACNGLTGVEGTAARGSKRATASFESQFMFPAPTAVPPLPSAFCLPCQEVVALRPLFLPVR